jgi:putative protein kinase ArgK-like GTPase of G3E family
MAHKAYLMDSGKLDLKRISNAKSEVVEMIKERIERSILDNAHNEEKLLAYSKQIVERSIDPFTVVDLLFETYKSSVVIK